MVAARRVGDRGPTIDAVDVEQQNVAAVDGLARSWRAEAGRSGRQRIRDKLIRRIRYGRRREVRRPARNAFRDADFVNPAIETISDRRAADSRTAASADDIVVRVNVARTFLHAVDIE